MIGWLDCSSGASGDMLLGALVGVGVPLALIDRAVQQVAPERVALRTEIVQRAGMTATRVHVEAAESHQHRTMRDVRELLGRASGLDPDVRERALRSFERLAVAEAEVHGTSVEDVHFHEVGALDAIADVVGVCAGFTHLGLDRLSVSTISVGSGTVRGAHGLLPVPPPAVVALLRGWVSVAGPAERELCTPTGAALVTSWANRQGPQPAMVVDRVGVGAGAADLPGHSNVLRLLVGEPASSDSGTDQLLLEANVDDLDPRLWPALLGRLIDTGATDAWLTPILMKKGRPAHTVSVLCEPGRREALLELLFAESSTIGVREHPVTRTVLERENSTVEVDGHAVRVKVARRHGSVVNVQPEYEDVARAAAATGRPTKVMLARAVAAAAAKWSAR